MNRRMLLESLLKTSRLPSEFQEVEYLESTGTQYIDSGFTPNQNSGLFIDYQNTQFNNPATAYCGTRKAIVGVTGFSDGFGFGYRGSKMNLVQFANVQSSNQTLPAEDLSRHTMFLNKTNFYKDDNLLWEFESYTFDGYGNIYLFRWNDNDANNYIAQMKLYSCQIYDNNVLVRNFVPCYRKADNVAGLYDLVNGVFYTNAGTGYFIVGGNV